MGQARQTPGDDDRALLGCLPPDGGPVHSQAIRRRLGWDPERYASACARLEDQGYLRSGHGRGKTVGRDLTAVPPEFRPACGHAGAHVTVRQVPVTVPHAVCDLTGVTLCYPGHGGATVPCHPSGIGNSKGFRLTVDPRSLDVTIEVTGPPGHA